MIESERPQFSELLLVTMQVYGASLTAGAISIWWSALERYPFAHVRGSLSAHVKNPSAGKFAPKPADIIGHIQSRDGRPGAEEAWAMIPKDEATTVVWTAEMAQSHGVALPLIEQGDLVAARMAFIEHYRMLVQAARNESSAVIWEPSLGHDPMGRECALMDAQRKGRLTAEHVAGLLPYRDQPPPAVAALINQSREPA